MALARPPPPDQTPLQSLHSPYAATSTPTHPRSELGLSPEQSFSYSGGYDTQSGSHSKPRLPRSESFNPSPPHRPEMNRAAHSLYAMGDSGSASQSMFPAGGDIDNGNDELTTKGRKRKRLAKACSACHVSIFAIPYCLRIPSDYQC